MKIGFDLDRIFIDHPPFIPSEVVDRLYRKKTKGELLYRIPTSPEQTLRRLSHLPLFRPPIASNISFLSEISKKHDLYLVSSRYNFLEDITMLLMKKYKLDICFDQMYFNFENKQPHIFKDEKIKTLKLDRFVDDDLPLLRFLTRENPQTLFFWLNNKSTKRINNSNIYSITDLCCILNKYV